MLIMRELHPYYTIEEICHWSTAYADDFHACRIVDSPQSFLDALTFFGRLSDALEQMGMTINTSKSKALIRLHGSKHRQVLDQHTSRTPHGHWLKIPSRHGSFHTVPIASEVGYLGTIVTYYNAVARTLDHRLTLSRVAFHRLKNLVDQ